MRIAGYHQSKHLLEVAKYIKEAVQWTEWEYETVPLPLFPFARTVL